jgi:TM2 domain-containing membrane protein YozV
MQTINTFTAIFFILLATMGIFAILLTMGYMVYGEEEED